MKIYVLNRKERAKRPLSIELFIIHLREGTEALPLLVYLIIRADNIRPYIERYLILREGTETLPYNERYWYFVEAIHELPVKLCKIADIAGFAETVKDFGCVNTLC